MRRFACLLGCTLLLRGETVETPSVVTRSYGRDWITASRGPWGTDAEEIERLYGVTVFVASRPFGEPDEDFGGEQPSYTETREALATLANELALYPEGLFQETQLRAVVITFRLRAKGVPLNGYTLGRRVYIDASASTLARTIHHEVFHVIEASTGDMAKRAWAALPPPRPEGPAPKQPWGDAPSAKRPGGNTQATPGFISDYAATSAAEDRAETFAALVADHALLLEKTGDDRALDAKAQAMVSLTRALHPGLDEEFWLARASDGARLPAAPALAERGQRS